MSNQGDHIQCDVQALGRLHVHSSGYEKKIIKQIILRSVMVSVKSGKWLIFEAFWFQA